MFRRHSLSFARRATLLKTTVSLGVVSPDMSVSWATLTFAKLRDVSTATKTASISEEE
jgi:hypothetical protein